MTSDKNSSQRLAILNPRPKFAPGPQLLHELALHDHKDPTTATHHAIDFLAADSSRTQLSYASLIARADALAATLLRRFKTHGVLNADRIIVPVYISQCPDLYVSLLAILKAGAAFCPQALDAPHDRLKFVFGDVGAKIVLSTTQHYHALLEIDGIEVLCVDDDSTHEQVDVEERPIDSNHPAYILYTSGSTGTPKGVVLSHLAVTQSLLAHDPVIPHFERFLQFASPTFDVSMFEIFFTLYRGATLVTCDRQKLLNDLPGVVNDMQVDAAELTPTVAGSLLGNRAQVPGLKVLLTIGEMLTRHVIDEFGAAANKPGLLQGMYGPTEAAIHCTLQENFKAGAKPGIIGTPLSTVSAFIVAVPADCNDDPTKIKVLQVGQVGELAVGGHQLADGYLNRDEQTKAAFIPTEQYGMLYRTGDKARLLADGTLECLGRISSGQIKLRGMRMELGEVEHAATTAKGCRVAIASVLNHNLVLFCLVDKETTRELILDACKRWLPSYMMPNEVSLRNDLPQLPSGKVDRKRLEAEYLEASRNDEPQVKNIHLSTEEEIASAILTEVLKVPVNLETKLSHSGLDSLSAIRVSSKLREKGYRIGAVDVLVSSTLKGLGSTLKKAGSTSAPTDDPPDKSYQNLLETSLASPLLRELQDKIDRVLPCSPLQASMLAETKQEPTAYCNWIKLCFDHEISAIRICEAFDTIIQQNEIFRSGFATMDGVADGFVQVVFNERIPITLFESDNFEYGFTMTRDEDFIRPLRIQMQERSNETHVLLQIHHALYDGWSMDLLLNDLRDILSSRDCQIRERPQFSRIVDYYKGLDSNAQSPAKDYWKSIMRGLKPLPIPELGADLAPKPQLASVRSKFPNSSDAIKSQLPDGQHPQTLFQATLSYLLSSYLGTSDLVFGSVTSGRTVPVTGVEEIMGPCIATLPLRVTIDQRKDSRSLLQAISASTRAMLKYCATPLQQIKSLAGVEPGRPFFDVLFIWQESLHGHGNTDSKIRVLDTLDHLEFNVVVEIEPQEQYVGLTLRYRESLWSARQAELFVLQFEAIAKAMLSDLSAEIQTLSASIPELALSTGTTDASTKIHNKPSELEVPLDTSFVILQRNRNSCNIVPRGSIGEICWIASNADKHDHDDLYLESLGSVTTSKFTGRMLPDSSIAILGSTEQRADTPTLSVEDLKEIDSTLSMFSQTVSSRTIFVSLDEGPEYVVGFWVPEYISSAGRPTALLLDSRLKSLIGRLYDHLLEKLPPHLIPSALVPVNDLSELQEQQQLSDLFAELEESYRQSVQYGQLLDQDSDDWSDFEISIADAVAGFVGATSTEIKLRMSFFSLGINSITAISLARTLTNAVGRQVHAADILRNPSVSRLAAHLEQEPEPSLVAQMDLITVFSDEIKTDITERLKTIDLKPAKFLPCTALQEAMLAAEISGDKQAYQNHTLFSVRCDLVTMQSAIKHVCSRHEILRTCFFTTEDRYYSFAQVVLADINAPIRVISSNIEDHFESKLDAVDTATPPLSFVFQKEEQKLLIMMHHVLYDGRATEILLQEIEQLCSGHELPLAPVFDEFLQYALATNTSASDSFWSKQLKSYISAPLYALGEKSSTNVKSIEAHSLQMGFRDVEVAAKRFDSTPLCIIQAAWALSLATLVDEQDVCFGNVVSGRVVPIENVSRLVAPCFNTIPVRLNMSKLDSITDIIHCLHSINSSSLEFQFTPLRLIQQRWNGEGKKLFDTLFLLQTPAITLNDRIWALEKDQGDMGLPIVCEIISKTSANQLELNLHYKESIYSAELANQVVRLFDAHLHSIVTGEARMIIPTDAFPNLTTAIKDEKEKALNALSASLKISSLAEISRVPSGLPSRSEILRKYNQSPELHDETDHKCNETDMDHTEVIIRDILASLTSVPVENISRHRTIFQLGLDSISAIQVAKKIRDQGIAVNAEDVLAFPSVGALNQALKQGIIGGASRIINFDFDGFQNLHLTTVCEEISCHAETIKWIMPCTAVQAGIIAQFQHTQGITYFNHWTFELGNISLDRLEEAWCVITNRHDMLRTGFVGVSSHEHPFAAVCYQEASEKSFNSLLVVENESQTAIRMRMLQSVLHKLHSPVWRTCVSKSGKGYSMHVSALHAIFDAKCLAIIFNDLWRTYYGHNMPLSTILDVRPLANTMLIGAKDPDGSHKQFWTSHLGDGTSSRFPSLTPERPVGKKRMERVTQNFSCQKSSIQQACQENGVTLQAALQAAFAILLSAYLGDAGVTFGVVLSGRTTKEANEVVFPLAVTLPFHADYYDNPEDLLKHAMDFNGSVRKHLFSPLTDIQRWVGAGKTSLFDCIVVLQESNQPNGEGFALSDEEGTAEYTVSLEMILGPYDEYEISVVCWDDMIPRPHAELMLRQFDSTLASLLRLEYPELKDQYLSIQPPLRTIFSTDITYMHEFVEQTSLKAPTRPALEFNWNFESQKKQKTWTYADLDSQGNRIAHYLLKKNLKPGSIIAICFDKCPEASFATYGILKAGSGFVAIDYSAPIARKLFIAKDSGAVAVLTMSGSAKELQDELTIPVISLDQIDLSSVSAGKPDVGSSINSQSTCYCLYTSGSTGTPKGCLISHYNAVQGLLAFKRIFEGRYASDSRWLQFASFHFDVSVLEQFWSWMVGICVVSAPRDLIFEDLAGTLRTLEITHLDLTPSLARLITPEDVPSLCKGVFITGGEQLRQEVLDAWGDTGVIHNFYGPSECTIGVTVNAGVGRNGKTSNIGYQFENVGSFVFKPGTVEPVFRGAPGELCLYGPLVGKGYLNRPELTEERFPYVEHFQQRIYRTGDLVKILHDGSFEFLGRIDDQVKLRGQRLELGEINNAVRESLDSIKDSHTMVIKDKQRQTDQIVTFVVLDSSETLNLGAMNSAILEGCKSRLPAYMVPSQVIWVEKMLPLTPNNKVDTKALRSSFDQSAKSRSDIVQTSGANEALESHTERVVAKVLASYMKLEETGINGATNVFQAGLDSISVFSFVRALREEGFSTASTQAVMTSVNISDLARRLSNNNQNDKKGTILEAKQAITACMHQFRLHAAQRLDVSSDRIEKMAPCTPLQQGMIARSLESMKDGRGLYFTTFLFTLSSDVNLEKLRTAWSSVIRQAAILRTEFVETNEGHIQVVLAPHEDMLKDMIRTEDGEPSGSVLARPLRVTLNNGRMTIRIFHALYDAISLQLVLESLSSEYHGAEGYDYGPSFFDALPYGPLKSSPESKKFWIDHLRGAQLSPFHGSIGPSNDSIMSATCKLSGLEQFDVVRRELRVTHQALIQASWISVLQSHLCAATTVGMVVSGRSIDFDGADRVIGPMFNTLPFFARLTKDDTFASAARKCHTYNIETLPYQHTSLSDVNKWAHKPGRQSLFDTLFVFQKTVESKMDKPQDPWEQINGRAAADYPLAFEAEQLDNETLQLQVVSLASVAGDNLPRKLLESFTSAIKAFLESPSIALEGILGQAFLDSCTHVHTDGEDNHTEEEKRYQFHDWSNDNTDQHEIAREVAALAGVKLASITPETTIFELGLDSIDAIKLSSRIKKTGMELPVSAIMRAQTIVAMAELCEQTRYESFNSGAHDDQYKNLSSALEQYSRHVLNDHSDIESIKPVTPLQEAMIAEMMASDCKNYFNHDVLAVVPETDLGHLKVAWEIVVAASPILRTSFLQIEDPNISSSYAQVIHSQNKEFWTSTNMSTLEAGTQTFKSIHEGHRESVLIEKAIPPWRVTSVQTVQGSFLVFSISHALYDGFSLGLLHESVNKAFYGHKLSLSSYEIVLKNILNASGANAEQFLADSLKGAQPCKFSQLEQGMVIHHKEAKSDVPFAQFNTFCKDQRITSQALAYTCWSFILATYSSTLDTICGLVLAGRDDEASRQALFPTMNTVAMRSIIHGTRTEMLRYAQSNLAGASQYQHFPLRKVQTIVGCRGLFNSLFIFQKRAVDSTCKETPLYTSLGGDSDLDYPVAVEMEILDGHIWWRAACSDSCLSEAGTEELLRQLDNVLQRIIDDPEAAAVRYDASGTSVCGLPSFHPQAADKSSLSTPDEGYSSDKGSLTVKEQSLCEVLANISRVPISDITKEHTLFHLGLDSISAIKVSSLLRTQKNLQISVSEMLRAGTVERIAEAADAKDKDKTDKTESIQDVQSTISKMIQDIDLSRAIKKVGVAREDVDEILPATAGQVYTLCHSLNSGGFYFWPTFRYRIRGATSSSIIETAWKRLVAATPVLRTSFVSADNKATPFLQVVLKEDACSRASVRPMITLAATEGTGYVDITLHLHHAMYDAVSLELITQRLLALCAQPQSEIPWNSATSSLAPFIASQYDKNITIGATQGFFKDYLSCEVAIQKSIKTDSYLPWTAVYKQGLLSHTVSQTLLYWARTHGITVQSAFLAAFSKVHAARKGLQAQESMTIGVYLANRNTEETASLPAPTLNFVPVLARSPMSSSILILAQQMQNDMQAINANSAGSQEPLWRIKEETGVDIDAFVNLLPMVNGPDGEETATRAKEFSVETIPAESTENNKSPVLTAEDEACLDALRGTTVAQAYTPCFDVEAAIRPNSGLDVGVFGPEGIIGREAAEEIIAELGKILGELK